MAMSDDLKNSAAEAAEREAATHGCCCKCCSIRAEIWGCFIIDITSILGIVAELPSYREVPAKFHMVDVLQGYLILSIISASIFLYALVKGTLHAQPRRLLVRWIPIKIVSFLVGVMGYFNMSPWSLPLAHWICETDFQNSRTVLGSGSEQRCVQMFLWSCFLNNLPYLAAYAYTLKASYKWFRCHPDNDDKGIWCSNAAARANPYMLMC